MTETNTGSDFLFTIEKESVAEFKDRGSRFLALAFPIEKAEGFRQRLKKVKAEHPKAVHHCFAYRLGTDGNNFRSSDDGEPSGTAGRPILGQIDSRGLTNLAVIVVRYFGGTLLGVPGLIHAYKTAASFSLQTIPVIKKPVLEDYTLQFDYSLMNDVMTIMKKHHCLVRNQDLQLFCLVNVGIPRSERKACLLKLREIHSLTITNS